MLLMKAKRSLVFLLLFFGGVAGAMGDACGPADAGVCAVAVAWGGRPFLRTSGRYKMTERQCGLIMTLRPEVLIVK